ncbi:MAG: PLP-dependent aminotransferase family protein, partial [Candidatus Binatia bacterium]
AGLHLVLALRNAAPADLAAIVDRAAAADVGVYSTREFYLGRPRRAEFLLGDGTLAEEEIREGIRRLAAIVP